MSMPIKSSNNTIGIAVQDGKKISDNSHVSNYNHYQRGTIFCTDKGFLGVDRIYNISDGIKSLKWAISGVSLYPIYAPEDEGFVGVYSDVINSVTNHSAIGYKDDYVYLIASNKKQNLLSFRNDILNSKFAFDGLISLDGGGSSQFNYNGIGFKSSRKIDTAVIIK